MGNSCICGCFKKAEKCGLTFGNQGSLDFSFLVEDESNKNDDRGFFSKLIKKHATHRKKPVLELVDNLINPQANNNYCRLSDARRIPSTSSCTSKDIQLQYLDARALLAHTTMSTPENSIDLEWEHETLPISTINDPSHSSWLDQSDSPVHVQNSDSDWSRVSSANSLEWDNIQNTNSPISEIDTDTKLLLSEIERLTNKTLEETGLDLSR